MTSVKDEYDVVVIGSGFGGAITACRLAQSGQSVCILEKGRRWINTEFPRSTGEVANHAFWDEKDKQQGRGFVEYLPFKNMDVVQGVGVGGGSLHYFNVHIQPPEMIFDQQRWPAAISKESMKPYYDVARDMLAANPITPPKDRELPRRLDVFKSAVATTGRQAKDIDICVHFGEDGEKSPGGETQNACDYCGNCLLGCHVNAKNTLDLNYIPLAEKHGAEVHPLHQAVNILPHGEGYNIEFKRLPDDPESGESTHGVVKAKKVVVSAGTLGSNELLLQSRRKGSLPKLSRHLGKHFSGNGDFLFAGTHYKDKEVDAGRGPSITAGVGYFKGDSQHIYIEDLGFPDPFMWYLNGIIPTEGRLFNTVIQAKNYLLRSIGLSANFEAERLLDGGFMTKFLPYLGMGTDAADGKLSLHWWSGKLDLDWRHKKSKSMFNDMIGHLKEISKESGGKFINSPLWDWPSKKLLTAHPLGGCVMSDNPSDGVVNEWGEVWNYPGLYVADGSIVPSAISVNPSATISALSERVAFHMIHGRELEENDPETPVNR